MLFCASPALIAMANIRGKDEWVEEVCERVGPGLRAAALRLVVWIREGLSLCSGESQPLATAYPSLVLHGPTGCGKSYLVQQIAACGGGLRVVTLTPDDYFTSMRSVGETRLAKDLHFNDAEPTLVVVESLERFVPHRKMQSPEEARISAIFLRSLDSVARSPNVVLLALTR